MLGQTLILRFNQEEAFLIDGHPIPLKRLDILGTFNSWAWWEIRVIKYISADDRIFVSVHSYSVGETPWSDYQLSHPTAMARIQKISFKSIDTTRLLRTQRGNQPYPTPRPFAPRKVRPLSIHESYTLPIGQFNFYNGGVSFDIPVEQLDTDVRFTVSNEHIRQEFDPIKDYFANVLQTKKIAVTISLVLEESEITHIEAQAPEILQINNSLIETVKYEMLKRVIKNREESELDNSILTLDELSKALPDEGDLDIFYEDEKHLIEDLLSITDSKHYQHLRFLSQQHEHSIMKLRFILSPFSFLFLLKGSSYYYIIWETLNTEEATYIWREDMSKLKQAVERIDKDIQMMRANGKNAFIHSAGEGFQRVYHDYRHEDGFTEWRKNLLEKIK